MEEVNNKVSFLDSKKKKEIQEKKTIIGFLSCMVVIVRIGILQRMDNLSLQPFSSTPV